MSQLIYKNGCWTCRRAIEDPQQQYLCPKAQQHLIEYQECQKKKPKIICLNPKNSKNKNVPKT